MSSSLTVLYSTVQYITANSVVKKYVQRLKLMQNVSQYLTQEEQTLNNNDDNKENKTLISGASM